MICPEEGNLLKPREPQMMKMIHLMYKEPSLYIGVMNFLHILLRYIFNLYNLVCGDIRA